MTFIQHLLYQLCVEYSACVTSCEELRAHHVDCVEILSYRMLSHFSEIRFQRFYKRVNPRERQHRVHCEIKQYLARHSCWLPSRTDELTFSTDWHQELHPFLFYMIARSVCPSTFFVLICIWYGHPNDWLQLLKRTRRRPVYARFRLGKSLIECIYVK